MTAIALNPLDLMPAHDTRDPDLLEITAPLPEWLTTAGESVCAQYSEQLITYHASAHRLEAHLSAVLPSFDEFVREQLEAQIKHDLGINLDPDLVSIDLPKSVSRTYDVDPQFARVINYSAPWVASTERERISLTQLAQRNFLADDEQMARRLDLAGIDLDAPPDAAPLAAGYLHALVTRLNVAQGYRTLLASVFSVPAMTTPQAPLQAHLLLEPYELQIRLLGFCEFTRKRLSADGHRMLTLATQARTRLETEAAGLEMHWVQFRPGASLSGASDEHTLAGLCVMRDRETGRALIYLPDAPAQITLIEDVNLAQVRNRLIMHLISTPELIEYVAERTLDSDRKAHHISYIEQALARGFDGFIQFAPALDLQLAAQQLQVRAQRLYQMTRTHAKSRSDLLLERTEEQNRRLLVYFGAMLGVLPGIGTLISLKDGLSDTQRVARSFSDGDWDEALLATGQMLLNVLDVALSVVPGASTLSMLARWGRRGAIVPSAALSTHKHVIKPFAGYEVRTSLIGAAPQSGRDVGTLLKSGQLWIQRDGQVYAVHRRGGEQTLRLSKTASQGYEPPIRLHEGRWVYHSDVGLKGGVRSTIAETLIAKAHLDPAFQNRHARQLLDQYRFAPESQRRMELDIAVYYQKHRTVPGWAEAYRKGERAPDTLPRGGGIEGTRPGLPTVGSAAGASSAAEVPISSPAVADAWKAWGRSGGDASKVESISVQLPIFRVSGEPGGDFVQIQGLCYDILPSGASQHPTIVFLRNPRMLEDTFFGLNETIRLNRYEQPLMASFTNGTWSVHGPLFKHKIQKLVEQARPGMTPASNRILAEKLFERADSAHSGLTATRLIQMRATLNAWQTGGLCALPHLNDPLLMLEGSRMTRIGTLAPRLKVSYGPSLLSFNRLDFTVSDPVLLGLRAAAMRGSNKGVAGKKTLRAFMSALLSRAGYTVVDDMSGVLQVRSILLFRRPGQGHLFMLNMRRFSGPLPAFPLTNVNSAVPMSNRWIDEWAAGRPADSVLTELMQERARGQLVKLMGGIKNTSATESGTQVFVQRIADDF